MTRTTVGIVLNGVTGRMGLRQHLVRSLPAIREQGGLPLRDGSTLWPEPVLVGRSEAKLREIADRHGLTEWSTDLAAALARPDVPIYAGRGSGRAPDRRVAVHRPMARWNAPSPKWTMPVPVSPGRISGRIPRSVASEPRGGRHRHAGPSGKENSAIDAGLRSEL
jgi:hypothetical protein